MNAEQLLAHYGRIADAPEAIPRLRRFILDLAVRGKLVPQDPSDERASELLKRIADHKAQLGTQGRIRKRKQGPSINPDAAPYSIPCSWAWGPFGEIVISRDGERVPVSKDERSRRAKIYDYYGASGVIDKIDGFLFDKPLLLIGEDGANLINRSTPIAFIARGQYWVNNHAHVIDGISEEFLRFLELYINAIDLTPYVTGTAQPKMTQAKMNGIPVALPPQAEQHRIVAKVDELMALCDRLEAARDKREVTRDRLAVASLARLNVPDPDPAVFQNHAAFTLDNLTPLTIRPDQIKALRQTILNLAVRGKLVPQDPSDEPASELLKRIAAERTRLVKARAIRKPKVLPNVAACDVPHSLPRTWAWVRLGDTFTYDAGIKREPRELEPDRWLLELEDIEKDTSTVLKRIKVNDRDSRSTKSEFQVNDILYGKLRPYLNKVVVADEPGYSTTEIVAIRPYLGTVFRLLCPSFSTARFR